MECCGDSACGTPIKSRPDFSVPWILQGYILCLRLESRLLCLTMIMHATRRDRRVVQHVGHSSLGPIDRDDARSAEISLSSSSHTPPRPISPFLGRKRSVIPDGPSSPPSNPATLHVLPASHSSSFLFVLAECFLLHLLSLPYHRPELEQTRYKLLSSAWGSWST